MKNIIFKPIIYNLKLNIMKKLLLLFLLPLSTIINAQHYSPIKLKSTKIAESYKIDEHWTEWSEWEDTFSVVVVDYDNRIISTYKDGYNINYNILSYNKPIIKRKKGVKIEIFTMDCYCIEQKEKCMLMMMFASDTKQLYIIFDDVKYVNLLENF